MNLRVLFVNDDVRILAGLKASLRRQRRLWRMTFVGGAAARRLLDVEAFDVVVTELSLEGQDGIRLLQHAASVQPGAVRVVLSANADPKGAMRAVSIAHQYLSMPCDPVELIRRIERSDSLRDLLRQDRIASLGALHQLPTPHKLYLELKDTLADPDAHIALVAEIVERDPAMSAKILQIVNSAFFSRQQRISNVRDAVRFLGLDLLQGLILQIGLASSLRTDIAGLSVEGSSEHALQVATLARSIAPRPVRNDAFTAGLLHDVGKLLLAVRFEQAYASILETSRSGREVLHDLERLHLDVSHAEAGAYLLGVWGLPDAVVEGVAWHHQPLHLRSTDLDVASAVHLADAIVCRIPANKALVDALGLESELTGWRSRFEEEMA